MLGLFSIHSYLSPFGPLLKHSSFRILQVWRYFCFYENLTHLLRLHLSLKLLPYFWWYRELNNSVTRLGDFWKFLVTNYLSKVAQMFGDFWGILKTLLFNHCSGFFLGNFRKNWATFLIHYLVTLVLGTFNTGSEVIRYIGFEEPTTNSLSMKSPKNCFMKPFCSK